MKAKHLVWKAHTSSSIVLQHVEYNNVLTRLLWKLVYADHRVLLRDAFLFLSFLWNVNDLLVRLFCNRYAM